MSTSEQSAEVNSIAIVSTALRVPGAVTPEQFWQNLCQGVESVERYDEAQLLAAGVSRHALSDPHYVRAGAPLPGMEQFDPEFFGLGPKEAAIMDPQQRQFLETAWEALERAGCVPARFEGSIGVFAGCGQGSYYAQNILRNRELVDSVGTFLLRHTGNDKDFLATRVSYCFDLRGPSVNVQTACSTSLVAVHLACQSLLSGECDLALAGGVTIELPHRQGYVFHEGEVLSPDGHCRAFDARAQGTVFGSGVAVVALRRLQDALDAGDPVIAVIKGSAVNNDGSRKVGYLAPSVDGQAAAISEALAIANVPAESIGLCECHGTGTAMGDPIEIAALTQAFTENSTRTGYCAVGSVKTNIGHLDTAAGAVALIKAALCLQHAQLPPSLNFEHENPEIGFAKTPFYVNTRLQPWAAGPTPRRAAVNSLGVGGTNAYVVLEEAPGRTVAPALPDRPTLISWSARNPRSLAAQQARLAQWIEARPELTLADIAHTLHHAREHFSERRVLAASSRSQLLALLSEPQSRQVYTHHHRERAPVVFMFPGGGAQYPRMGAGLLAGDAVYREHFERGLGLALEQHALPLRELLLCAAGAEQHAPAELERPSLQLPLLFIVEYALAQSWLARGVKPSALIGHSMGENTAACVAGVMDFATTLGLTALRGRLFESLPDGGMLSVPLSAAALRPLLPQDVVIACENAPELCVASGPRASIVRLQQELSQRELDVQPIRIRVAAHSPMLEPILGEFAAYLRRAKLSAPKLPIISNLTGLPLTAAEAQDPDYWVRHLRSSVRFEAGIRSLEAQGPRVYLEVGPGRALGSLVRQCTRDPKTSIISSLRHPDERVDDADFALAALGRLWASGADVDISRALPKQGRRVLMPTYAFDHQPYFIPLTAAEARTQGERHDAPQDWFYTPVWGARELSAAELSEAPEQTYLLFADDLGIADRLASQLAAAGHRSVFVRKSGAYGQTDVFEYEVAPGAPHSYETLVQELRASEKLPDRIVHLWGVDAASDDPAPWRYDAARRVNSWDSAFHLARALAVEGVDKPIKLTLVTSGAQRVSTEPVPSPEKTLVRGVQAVLPRELPELGASWIDVAPPRRTRGRFGVRTLEPLERLVSCVEREARAAGSCTAAYRDGQRFERGLSFTPQPQLPEADIALRERGVYLITGGLGGLGLRLAEQLARTRRARLALVSRRRLPPRTGWPGLLRDRPASDPLARTLKSLQAIEASGGEVELISADVADLSQMRDALGRVRSRFGALHGIFHTAGLLDDKLLAHKSWDEAERVLRPKLEGTWVLHQLTQRTELELLVLFSSTSTFLGPPGQVDYVAANAFLEGYAQAQRAAAGPRCVVVQWGAFRDVGMAAEALRTQHASTPELESTALSGALFELQRTAADGSVRFEREVSARNDWWVDEHRLQDGSALVPGTGHLQLMAAGAQLQGVGLPCVLRQVAFVRPLFVPEHEPLRVSLRLSPLPDGSYTCELESELAGRSELHASAQLAPYFDAEPARIDLGALRARMPRVVQDAAGLVTAQEQHLRFGPRFRSLRVARYGEGEALGELRLSRAFEKDLEHNALHAGLLDIGTGFAMELIAGYSPDQGLWAPLSYRSLVLHRALPAHCFAWVRTHGAAHAQASSLAFDVQLCDADGRVCVEVSELTLRRIARGQTFMRPETSATVPAAHSGGRSAAQQAFERTVAQGIDADEGMDVLVRLLGTGISSCLISPVPPDQLLKNLTEATSPRAQAGTRFARPELSSAFVQPSAGVQRVLADIWAQVLGIEQVGAQDDFFELGGHSLTAVRLTNAVRKQFGVELGLAALFEAPTVERLAQRIAPDAMAEPQPARTLSGITVRGSRGFTPVVPIKPLGSLRPLFCVAGQGGNPMHLRTLAHYLGADRPFYGLQHRGLDGQTDPYRSVEEMAEDFLLHMRELAAGPYLIAGYSGGGTAAFEMARQLTAAGERVDALVLLDSFCPLDAEPSFSWRARAHLSGLRREGLAYAERRVRSRLRDGRKQLEARLLGQAPVSAQSRSLFETAAANWQSIEQQYRPVPLACDAYLLRVQSQSSDEARYFERRYRAWEKLILGGVHETIVPGTHVSMCEEPNVQTLAERLREVLAGVDADVAAAQ